MDRCSRVRRPNSGNTGARRQHLLSPAGRRPGPTIAEGRTDRRPETRCAPARLRPGCGCRATGGRIAPMPDRWQASTPARRACSAPGPPPRTWMVRKVGPPPRIEATGHHPSGAGDGRGGPSGRRQHPPGSARCRHRRSVAGALRMPRCDPDGEAPIRQMPHHPPAEKPVPPNRDRRPGAWPPIRPAGSASTRLRLSATGRRRRRPRGRSARPPSLPPPAAGCRRADQRRRGPRRADAHLHPLPAMVRGRIRGIGHSPCTRDSTSSGTRAERGQAWPIGSTASPQAAASGNGRERD